MLQEKKLQSSSIYVKQSIDIELIIICTSNSIIFLNSGKKKNTISLSTFDNLTYLSRIEIKVEKKFLRSFIQRCYRSWKQHIAKNCETKDSQ